MSEENNQPSVLKGQVCPGCNRKTLTLIETQMEIPYFGLAYIFSVDCESDECDYHMADVEFEKNQGPIRIDYEITKEDDLKLRVVKSGSATVKLPRIMTIEPGPASNGYVTNVEGILNRVKKMLENVRDEADDKTARKKAKNQLKKIQDVMWGNDKIVLTIEDPNGNSAIISPDAKIKKLPKK